MPSPSYNAIVSIRDEYGDIKGQGFLAGGKYIVTCAHVVNSAIGRFQADDTNRPEDTAKVAFGFPLNPSLRGQRFQASIHHWGPTGEEWIRREDYAILALDKPLEVAVEAPDLKFGVRFSQSIAIEAYGSPEVRSDGLWEQGQIVAPDALGLVQIQTRLEIGIRPGFSGTAVLDQTDGCVLGIMVSRVSDLPYTAHMLPLALIEERWPTLRELDPIPDEPILAQLPKGKVPFNRETESLKLDRVPQVQAFNHFLSLHGGAKPRRPKVVLIQGPVNEAHRRLVERFYYLMQAWLAEEIPSHLVNIPPPFNMSNWPDFPDKQQSYHQDVLLLDLCQQLKLKRDARLPVNTIAEAPHFQSTHFLLLRHQLHADDWSKRTNELLEWYLKTYWSSYTAPLDRPGILLIFELFLPSGPKKKGFSLFKRKDPVEQIQDFWEKLLDELEIDTINLRPLALDPLQPVSEKDYRDWLDDLLNVLRPYKKAQRPVQHALLKVKDHFRDRKSGLPMEEMELILNDLLDELEQQFIP